jgi:mannitol/fructose-specific phosphotransferase system IIA component (Ntr-type)
MAFPHARLPALKLSFALGRSAEPLVWGPKTAPPVRLVFLLAVPATDTAQYLALVSGLAHLAKENRFIEGLLRAEDPVQTFALLHQIPLRIKPMPPLQEAFAAEHESRS